MKLGTRMAVAGLVGQAVLLASLVAPSAARASAPTPAWETSDTNVNGTLQLFDSTGHVMTAGDLADVPFVSYAVASTDLRANDTKATLYGATPDHTQDPGNWNTYQLTASRSYPNAAAPGALATAHPMVSLSGTDGSLQSWFGSFPNTDTTTGYQNVYQLRLVTSAPGQTPTTTYATADLQVDTAAGTWTQIYPVPPAAVAPGTPTGVSATPGAGSADVSWTKPENNGGSAITRYTVTATPNPANGDAPTVQDVSGSTSTTLSGLKQVPYDVTVTATSAAGTSPASAAVSVTPNAPPPPPAPTAPGAPTGVSAVASNGAATVSFSAPGDGGAAITGYTVTASTGQTATGSGSPIVVTGLANDISRTFTVTATNSVGPGPASAASNAVIFSSSTLSIRPTTGVSIAGTSLRVYGTLVSGPAAARPVTVYSYPAGHAATATTIATSATGTYSLTVRPVFTTVYKVVYAGDATHAAVTSAFVRVTVRTKLTITAPRNGARTTSRTLKVLGTTSPNKHGVYVYLNEIRGTRVVRLAAVRVGATGTFGFLRTFAKGTHVLQVVIGATALNAAGSSPRTTFYEV